MLTAAALALLPLVWDGPPACCQTKPSAVLALNSPSSAACNGSASCRVCTNCSRCAHCKGGGSCGVCSAAAARRTPEPPPPPPRPSTRRKPPEPAKPAGLTLRSPGKGKPVVIAGGPRSWRALHPAAGKAVDPSQVIAFTTSGLMYNVDHGTRVVELGRHVFREGETVLAPDAIAIKTLEGPRKGKIGYVMPGTARDSEGKVGPASAGPDGVESTFEGDDAGPEAVPPKESERGPQDRRSDVSAG